MEEETIQCRICLCDAPAADRVAEGLIAPCHCRGSAQFVHRGSLRRLLSVHKPLLNSCSQPTNTAQPAGADASTHGAPPRATPMLLSNAPFAASTSGSQSTTAHSAALTPHKHFLALTCCDTVLLLLAVILSLTDEDSARREEAR